MTNDQSTDAIHRAECYNPLCDQPVDWPAGMHEVYCSESCADEARSGRANRVLQPDSDHSEEA